MALTNPKLSEQDYLNGEQLSELKHEYINGQLYAMTGVSKNHARISSNLIANLHPVLAATPYELFAADMKVKVEPHFFYPDVMVVCNDPNEQEYYTEVPLIIVEILSKSTRRIDKTLKRLAYQSLPSLKEYVLIEQDFVEVEVCRSAQHWQSEFYFLGDEVYFAAIDCYLPVKAIYERVNNEDMRADKSIGNHNQV